MKPEFVNNNKERLPFEHYLEIYEKADPFEISARTGLSYDGERKCFSVYFMGSLYEITFPEYEITKLSGWDDSLSCGWAPAQILVLRFMTGGRFAESSGGFSAYQDMPWGNVYYQNFYGRCILRLAYAFNGKAEKLATSMKELCAKEYSKGDMGYEFQFMKGLSVRISVWNGDDEFPPSAQILFSDNFRYAFTAEDMAFVGDIFIKVLKGQ